MDGIIVRHSEEKELHDKSFAVISIFLAINSRVCRFTRYVFISD